MSVRGAQERISKTVTSWEGVTSSQHRFGGVEYVVGKREIGHIHGDSLVDIPFPKKYGMESWRQGERSRIISCPRADG